MAILIRNGTVVNCDWMKKADVLIENEKIIAVGNNLEITPNIEHLIEATGKYVMPGGIDPHTHLETEVMGAVSIDDFYHGSRAALAGGTTMFIDFLFPSKTLSTLEAYQDIRKRADEKVCCDYAISMCLNRFDDSVAQEMSEAVKPEYGINSFKFFMAYSDLMLGDAELYRAMRHCANIGAIARIHAENGHIIIQKQKELLKNGVTGPEGHPQSRPEEVEAEAVNRSCMIAEQANCPLYIVHIMSTSAASSIAKYRERGAVIFGETIAAALGTDGSHYYSHDWHHAAGHVMSPPLNSDPKTSAKLMDFLACDELNLTGTDNCTFTKAQRRTLGKRNFTQIPNGINGIEDRMSVVWEKGVYSGKLDPMRFVEVTSSAAAKIFNIYPQKSFAARTKSVQFWGRIEVGSDADVIIWDPNATRIISAKTHHHACDFNIFEGMKVHGVCEITISRGRIVWDHGKLNVKKGSGRFIVLPPFSQYCYAKIPQLNMVHAPRIISRPESDLPEIDWQIYECNAGDGDRRSLKS